jgi:hypothetical protein
MRSTTNLTFLLAVLTPAFDDHAAIAENDATEGSCSVVATDASGGNATIPIDDLHVLAATASAGAFLLPAGSPSSAKAVVCERSSLVPALHDDKVVLAGYPFAIAAETKLGRRLLWLEIANGKFQVSYDPGVLTHDEQEAVQSRMNEFQNRLSSARNARTSVKSHE